MPYFMKGQPDDVCAACGDATRPVLRLWSSVMEQDYTPYCILCIVRWVDSVTGWSMATNVLQALAVGDASARFRAGLPPRPGNGSADRAKRWRQARKPKPQQPDLNAPPFVMGVGE
jgi:hypothetical protein